MIDIWIQLFNCAIFSFSGYLLGEMIGYCRGIKSAGNIWREGTEIITKTAMEIINRKKD